MKPTDATQEPAPETEQKMAALSYVSEAWAEARLDGIDDDCMSLFADAGQVAPRVDGFAWRSFTKTYGVGVSLHTLTNTITRIEVARTPEGTSLLFSFGPSF